MCNDDKYTEYYVPEYIYETIEIVINITFRKIISKCDLDLYKEYIIKVENGMMGVIDDTFTNNQKAEENLQANHRICLNNIIKRELLHNLSLLLEIIKRKQIKDRIKEIYISNVIDIENSIIEYFNNINNESSTKYVLN